MRTRIPIILLSFALIAVLALNSQAIYDGSGGSADQLIDASKGIITPVVDTRFPTSPQEARALRDAKKNIEYSDVPIPVSSDTIKANSSVEVTKPNEPAAIISGNWSFELNDSTLKEVILTLSQSDDTIFGTGSFEEGNNTLNVTASGTMNMDELNLDLMPAGTANLYMLALAVRGDYATGDYKAISPGGKSWTGEARGNRIIDEE
jgi:hypothetical protein